MPAVMPINVDKSVREREAMEHARISGEEMAPAAEEPLAG